VIGGTEADGTPTVLPRLPEPSEQDQYGQEYWWNTDDHDQPDSEEDNNQPQELPTAPTQAQQSTQRRRSWFA
jgi:hypothetical protein